MRFRAILLVALIVLSGCSGLMDTGNTPTPTATPPSATETKTATDSNPTETSTPSNPTNSSDSPAIGRENGIRYNATLSINTNNGLNKTERKKVISRSMARIEYVREKEFKRSVPISLQSRKEYKQQASKRNYSKAFRQFDNEKFEAMFLIGEKKNSLAVQQKGRSQSVLGYYSSKNDSIVIVTDSKTPSLSGESTLAHELTHALQDQYYNLTNYTRVTRDGHSAMNGLIEGGASFVQHKYMSHCGKEWKCLPSSQKGGSPPANWGVYFLNYFPYADGPQFVNYNYQRGGWERVSELFENPPASAEQVIRPSKYGEDAPTNVTLKDRTRNEWTRVRPEPPRSGMTRPDYGSLGQSALTAMFAGTIGSYDNKRGGVIPPKSFLNFKSGSVRVNTSDPFNYGIQATDGWDGDRLHVYQKNGKSSYVWKIVWDSPKDASEFAKTYRSLLKYRGATKVGTNTWVIKSGPFADAFSVKVTGDAVVIVNAPTVADLNDVRTGS
jgi:hypothetical protein